MQVGSGRIVFAFIAFLPLFIYHYKAVNWAKIKPLIVVGLCGSGLPAVLYATGQSQLPSAVAGVLNSLTPICTLLISILFFTKRFDINQLVGVFIGLVGVSIIFFIKEDNNTAIPFFYAGLILLATVCYGISANTVSHYLSQMRPILISTLSFVLIGPFALVYLLSTDFINIITHTDGAVFSLVALITLSIVGTFLANILFFKLIQITEPVFSSTVSYLIPFVALGWGFVDGEYISIYHILALALILGGIVVIKFAKNKN